MTAQPRPRRTSAVASAAALRAIAGNLDAFGRQSHFAMWTSKFVLRELSARIGCLLRDARVFALDRGGGTRFLIPPAVSQPITANGMACSAGSAGPSR